MLSEIENFVVQLRAHFHAVGVADADRQADDYATAVADMYRLRGESLEATEHFSALLEIYRLDISFLEKRVRLRESIACWCEKKKTEAPRVLN